MTSANMTGRWVGHYLQHGEEHPITADILETDERISGFMYDGRPDRDYSVFQVTSDSGMPPGSDEEIEANLRGMLPDAPAGPVRYVSHLPSNSILRGRRTDQAVYFLKTYQGTAYGGYQVGDHFLGGYQEADHEVQYEGQLSRDGLEVQGRWWIEPNPEDETTGAEGQFRLRRAGA